MTETRTESLPPIPVGMAIGQAVGQAETALSRLLRGVLEEAGTTRETYLALARLLAHPGGVDRAVYLRDLSDALSIDLWSAGELADSLVADGLLTLDGGDIRIAPAGAELRERVRRGIGDIAGPLYAQFDPADIETTVATLVRLTTLARAAATGGR